MEIYNPDTTFRMGKYENFKIKTVVINDRKYCENLIKQTWLAESDSELFDCLFYNLRKPRVDIIKKYGDMKIESDKNKEIFFLFDQYKGRKIKDIWVEDNNYCKNIIHDTYINIYYTPTIITIHKLIEEQNNHK